jgi:glycosyltransferase involved in cell wall biosynthesis
MKLSILLVTYNQDRFIRESLESILRQKIPFGYELIVADDFSSDSTIAIIEELLNGKDCNYRILTSENNIGISKNYQRGFNECRGEYIAVMEGDDYWTDPERLNKHITFLDSHPECVMSFNRIISFYEESKRFQIQEWAGNEEYEYITSGQLAKGARIGNLTACVFRRSEIQKLKSDLFELEIADWMLGITLGQYGLIACLKEAMSVYRINARGQWGKMTREEQIKRIIQLIDIYNKYLEFRFNKEFTQYRAGLSDEIIRKPLKFTLYDYIPPVIIYVAKWLIPNRFRIFFKTRQ